MRLPHCRPPLYIAGIPADVSRERAASLRPARDPRAARASSPVILAKSLSLLCRNVDDEVLGLEREMFAGGGPRRLVLDSMANDTPRSDQALAVMVRLALATATI